MFQIKEVWVEMPCLATTLYIKYAYSEQKKLGFFSQSIGGGGGGEG